MKRAALVVLAALGSLGFGREVVLTPAHTFVEDDAVVKRGMTDELARSMKELKLGDSPRPYYISYALSDVQQATAMANFGAATAAVAYRGRTLRTDVRVGSPDFDNSNTSESPFSANIESLPVDDDYAAFRRELWLRTDEAYKNAVEALAKKKSAAAGQVADEDSAGVPDFSAEKPAQVIVPFVEVVPDPGAFLDTVTRLSALFKAFPEIYSGKVSGTYATVRRRFASSENASADETSTTMRVDVAAETQAPDGMRLVDFVTFTALDPAGLPPFAEMQQAVERMARELVAMRAAPIAPSGVASVLFEGPAAAQLAKLLIADNVAGTPAPRTAGGGEERSQSSEFADRLGQKVAAPLLMAVDDPTRTTVGKIPLYGAYRVDDEGVPAARVPLIDGGVLKSLLMTRIPRKELAHSNGHARATRFSGPRAAIGNLILSGKPGAPRVGLSRAALLDEMRKAGRGGGLASYVIRLLDDPQIPGVANAADAMAMISISGGGRTAPSVKPLVAYRITADGKEELVRGLTLEGIIPRSLKDIVAIGKDVEVYNFDEGGLGFVGVPSSIVTPPLLLSDVDIRRAVGKHKRPPLYPRPPL